ncbi:META domain-containing protein [Solitalea lacus]|uniref:META domain-containing protein n=1 Tax=Solitalea lacus TaxID=2911172 RepID=UPI001EDC0EB2|nr:META domain-containing protein [Solitalea lacus]UKJ07628.1 META domain-containing protein [Solitalea lacus]
MKNNLFNYLSALLFVTITSCGSTKDASINNTRWELNEVEGVVIDYIVNPKAQIFLTFDESQNKFSGSTGCNTIGGKLTTEGSKMHLADIFSTQMACPKMQAEREYLRLLETVDNYKLNGKKLILYQGTKQIASYTRSKNPVPPIPPATKPN